MSFPNPSANNPAVSALGHVDALPVGTVLDEFEIQGLLGVGGFGMVYRGYDHSLHRPVAIKEYMPTALAGRSEDRSVHVRSTGDTHSFATGLQSFISEARLLARFDHPSLVKVYRFWESNGTAYMAMPLYQGVTLKEARRRMSGPPPESWLRDVIWSVLSALRVLHENHTLHRDVSPDNIFLQDVGPPVLLDLGAARRAILDHSQKHTAILKVNYAPIEQYADAKDLAEGPWTDLYALAAVMHACLCNESPLPATFRAVRDRMPSVAQIAQTAQSHFGQSYSSEFVKALHHALHIEPDGRTQSIDAFIADMALQAPTDIMAFNWRTALGPDVLLSEFVGTHALTLPLTEAATTVPHQSEGRKRARKSSNASRAKAGRVEERAPVTSKPRRAVIWFSAGLFLLVLAVTLWMGYERNVDLLPDKAISDKSPTKPAPSPAMLPGPVLQQEESLSAQPAKPTAVKPPAKVDVTKAAKPPPTSTRNTQTNELPQVSEGAKSPAEVCADANVLTRTMCIYKACQRPEFFALQVCVEDRKRWEQSNKIPTP